MKRRQVLKGILGATALGVTSYKGLTYFLDSNQLNTKNINTYATIIQELTEVIIPATDTPGAKDAEVFKFVINYIENCATKKEYRNFLNGLEAIEQQSIKRYKCSFVNCTNDHKYILLNEFDNSFNNSILAKIDTKIRGKSFFSLLRDLTIEGYCTSNLGATEFLEYQHIPGDYIAVTTFNKNQKAWAIK